MLTHWLPLKIQHPADRAAPGLQTKDVTDTWEPGKEGGGVGVPCATECQKRGAVKSLNHFASEKTEAQEPTSSVSRKSSRWERQTS